MTFRVGQKVVCVDDSNFWSDNLKAMPQHGSVYVIRGFSKGIKFDGSLGEGVLLEGLLNPISARGNEYSFDSNRFRPIVERKTDISFAHEILKKASKKQGADA